MEFEYDEKSMLLKEVGEETKTRHVWPNEALRTRFVELFLSEEGEIQQVTFTELWKQIQKDVEMSERCGREKFREVIRVLVDEETPIFNDHFDGFYVLQKGKRAKGNSQPLKLIQKTA